MTPDLATKGRPAMVLFGSDALPLCPACAAKPSVAFRLELITKQLIDLRETVLDGTDHESLVAVLNLITAELSELIARPGPAG